MRQNITIISLTRCGFMQKGFECLLKKTSFFVNLIKICNIDDDFFVSQMACATAIFVFQDENTPIGLIKSRMQIKRLTHLMIQYDIWVPCFFLRSDLSVLFNSKICRLSLSSLSGWLDSTLKNILIHPDLYIMKIARTVKLNEKQKNILYGLLSGKTEIDIARKLNTPIKTIYSNQQILLQRLGLRNRRELLFLLSSERNFMTTIINEVF